MQHAWSLSSEADCLDARSRRLDYALHVGAGLFERRGRTKARMVLVLPAAEGGDVPAGCSR